MTPTINLALDETNHMKELERFSGKFKNNINVELKEFNFNDILLKGNSILEMQSLELKIDKLLTMPLIEMFPNILENVETNIGGNLF